MDYQTVLAAIIAILMSSGFAIKISKGLETIDAWHKLSSFAKYAISALLTALAMIAGYLLMSSPTVQALPANHPEIAGLFAAVGWYFVELYHSKFKDTAPEPGLAGS